MFNLQKKTITDYVIKNFNGYEKTREFEKAYTLCDKALTENTKWHYNRRRIQR